MSETEETRIDRNEGELIPQKRKADSDTDIAESKKLLSSRTRSWLITAVYGLIYATTVALLVVVLFNA